MSLYKDEAVVLRTMRLGESDRLLSMLGRSSGKIRGVAKGVRKTKSRFGGRLEPFSHVSLVLWRGKSGLDTINQVEVVEPFRQIREDLDKFAVGEIMLEAIDKVVEDSHPSPRTFRLLVDSLQALGNSPSTLVLAGFLLRLSSIAGFAPCLNGCAECGEPAGWFSPAQGGAVCFRCKSLDAEEVAPGMLELLSDISGQGAWMETDETTSHTANRLARFYTEYHIERRLRSASFDLRRAADLG